jgi:K+-sensing histidine kinase KdpD
VQVESGAGSGLIRLFFPEAPTSATVRYTFAAACFALAFVFRLLLDPALKEHSPLVLFALAVAVSAIRGGRGPGIVATVLGLVGSLYFFPPVGAFSPAREYRTTVIYQLMVFLVVGLIVSWLGGELWHLRWNAVKLANERSEVLERLRKMLAERDAALEKVRMLSGLLPICASCKRIRDDQGHWQQMESYIAGHSEAQFSHGLCPACASSFFAQIAEAPSWK